MLGVLLDNAVEAALAAQVRYVSVEMRNVNDACEVIVKNTYAGEITEARLMSGGRSVKPGTAVTACKACGRSSRAAAGRISICRSRDSMSSHRL